MIALKSWLRITSGILAILGGVSSSVAADEPRIDFVRDVRPILETHCYACHGADRQKSGLRLDIREAAFRGGELYGAAILAERPDDSPLIQFLADPEADLQMPPEGERLSPAEIDTLRRWVRTGAVWPEGVDLATLEDKRDHWSFKPVQRPAVPEVSDTRWPRNEIDRFILARLEEAGMRPSEEADRRTWLRRVSFDLIGLPPTPEQIDAFLADPSEEAWEHAVDDLLGSPHYGERWGQHWLDVVRYADTHGFEVNTPRPNAWPYRDYVIEAFNSDTPYDRFVSEQLAGDAMGQDAATGFLVTAAVLLPGQIGKDEPSIRLARQDALAEMLINTGEAFLGMSVGCARCHDHKFDPISQRDYYSLQAFFSGVRYEDRPIQSPEAETRAAQANQLREQVARIDQRLQQFQPLARPGKELRITQAQFNEERFEPVSARFVRFTIHDANLHPSLGLIEPCLDEFEIYTADAAARNVALQSAGAVVTASGSRTSAAHQLAHLHDGQYGNSRSWMSDEAGRGWVQFELAEPTRIDRVVWSRDRNGEFTDRLATAFTLEIGESLDSLQPVVVIPPRRAAIAAARNVDRFAPVTTKALRFTVHETNSLEPCLDELEVFDLNGVNVALASAGTRVTSSGDAPPSDRHRLEYLHDGQYGNGRSWISSEAGRGWVELTFSAPHTIDRVVWGRDREGKFTDRLPLRYSISIAPAEPPVEKSVEVPAGWRTVADASDRHPRAESGESAPLVSLAGLTTEDAAAARKLLDEQQSLQVQIDELSAVNMVFAGSFQEPEATHLLVRGDPEQPRDEVAPAVLSALGSVQLPMDTGERQRREALAAWIARPDNPLTARVMVNRIWQWHFGMGIVETASDFGRSGAAPSHPELLDWLADEFVRAGWSMKQMHRLIVLSATYRQSNTIRAEAQAVDAGVRLLWRFPARRLEAEAIRDSLLAVSGRLNRQRGGPGFDLFKSRGGLSGFPPVESFGSDGLRRMVYAHKIRMEREVVFGAFDCPDAGQTTARRLQSTTPIQALNLFNSRFTIDEADAFASRVIREVDAEVAARSPETGDAVPRQIRRVYRLALGRDASDAEVDEAEPLVREFGLSLLCRAIYNSNEFLFLP